MDKMFAARGLKTYGRRCRSRKTNPEQQEINDILFTEKAFRETEDLIRNVQNDKGDTQRKKGNTPIRRMSQKEKVRNWLEKSSPYFMDSSDYSSIEVMRESQHNAVNKKKQLLEGYEVLSDNELSLVDSDPVKGCIRNDQNRSKRDFVAELQLSPLSRVRAKRVDDITVTSISIHVSGQPRTDNAEVPFSLIYDSGQSKNNVYTDEEPTGLIDGPKKRKYLDSTRKFGVSATPSFPADMSSIDTDRKAIQKIAENTPKPKSDFRLPRVAAKKCKTGPGKRKPQPRSSTRLIMTDCEDVVDNSPHLSSIRPDSQCTHRTPDNTEQAKSDLISHMKTKEINDDDVDVRKKQCEHAPVKTSTPNTDITENGEMFFEFDISSVGIESDDEILQPRQSTKILNSEEFISLSNIMVDTNEDLFLEKIELLKNNMKDSAHALPQQKIHQPPHCNEKALTNVSHQEEGSELMKHSAVNDKKELGKVPVRRRRKKDTAVKSDHRPVGKSQKKVATVKSDHRPVGKSQNKVATVKSDHRPVGKSQKKIATVKSDHSCVEKRQKKVTTVISDHRPVEKRQKKDAIVWSDHRPVGKRQKKVATFDSNHVANASSVDSECDRQSWVYTRRSRRNYSNTKHAEIQSGCANSVGSECGKKSGTYTRLSARMKKNNSTPCIGTESNTANSVDSEFGEAPEEYTRQSETNQTYESTSHSIKETKKKNKMNPSVQIAFRPASHRSKKPSKHQSASSDRPSKTKCVSSSSHKPTHKPIYVHDVEICTFMNEGFTCPFNNLSKRLQGTVKHEMSYHDLIQNIRVDDLL